MTLTQADKARAFRVLHEGPAFVIPNPWDGATARILAGLGFKALATSSGAAAATLGRRDGRITREEAMAHSRLIAAATELPVSGDLEHGFFDEPAEVANTVRMAADAGLVACSIEDCAGPSPVYDFDFAVERVAAAVEAARKLEIDFMVTGRTQTFVRGQPDLDETIRRLQAFERAGADVLMAPGLPDLESVRAVCSATRKPFNFMAGIAGKSFSVAELEAAGVRRISVATSLHRAAMNGFLAAARELRDKGTFDYIETSAPAGELAGYLQA